MRLKRARILFVGFLLAVGSMTASGAPVLLGEIAGDSTGNHTGPIHGLVPTNVVFVLGYSPPDTFACPGYMGCERVWALGETGSFDFNSSNAAEFAAIVANLTDGVSQNLSRGAWTINTDPTNVFPGSIGSGPDSFFDFLGPGVTIDFIRLVVTATDYETSIDGSAQFTKHQYEGTWQLWGTKSIPEPATLALLGLGLLGLGFSRRKSRV